MGLTHIKQTSSMKETQGYSILTMLPSSPEVPRGETLGSDCPTPTTVPCLHPLCVVKGEGE